MPRSREKKHVHVTSPTSIQNVLKQLNIKPDTCLTLIKNNPVPVDTIIEEGQSITLIEVTSGG